MILGAVMGLMSGRTSSINKNNLIRVGCKLIRASGYTHDTNGLWRSFSLSRLYCITMADQNNEFAQRYQNFSDRKLLDIVQHHRDYVPEAVAAAKAELATRDLSEEEMADLKTEVERYHARRVNWDWMSSKLVQRFMIWWGKKEVMEKLPILTALGLAGWMVITCFRRGDWEWTYYMIRNGTNLTGYELLLWTPYLAGITAVILLAMRKKAGWIIATAMASGFAVVSLYTAAVGVYNYLFIILPNFYVLLHTRNCMS